MTNTARTMATQFSSTPNSQASSFDDSNASQGSYQRPISSGGVHAQALQRENTPTTSLSNPSSQEQILHEAQPSPSAGRQRLEVRGIQAPIAPMLQIASDTAGLKRTADGQVKEKSPTSPMSARCGHSRTSSMTSRGSQIGELSSQLKTRLSYAMVKVQHGWESHNLTELETLTNNSARTSPLISPTTTSLHSPRSRPTSSSTQPTLTDRPTYPQSPGRPNNAPHHSHTGTSSHEYTYQRPHNRSPISATGTRTYESFWREHSDPSLHSHSTTLPPSLAPPADIMPRQARQPPRLQTTHPQPTSRPASSYNSPATPPSSYAKPKPRTPSQNAAMEKDAVETLVFMSSPKNSGYHRSQKSEQGLLGTPLRRQISGRQDTGLAKKPPPAPEANGARRKIMTDGDVERMLDESSAGESSDE